MADTDTTRYWLRPDGGVWREVTASEFVRVRDDCGYKGEGRMSPEAPWMAKTRNPQDATLRNIRALKARVSKLEQQMRQLQRKGKP